jgi:hypothetical protein
MKKTLSYVGFLLLISLCLPAYAVVIFDNGDPDQVSGLGITNRVLGVEDFSFVNDQDVTDVHFYTLEEVGTSSWDTTMFYVFYEDDGSGEPGAAIAGGFGNGVNVNKMSTGNLVNLGGTLYEEFVYDFDLQTALALAGGTEYWIGLYLGAASTGILWETTGSGYGSFALANVAGFPNFFNTGRHLSFQLTGVPIPPTALLFLLGMAGMAATHHRRSRRSSSAVTR